MPRKSMLYGLLLLIYFRADAQSNKLFRWLDRIPHDTSYVESYYEKHLHVTLISNSQNLYLNFKNDAQKVSASYRPNNVFRFGFGLDYNIFSMEYTHSIDAIDRPQASKGNTESFNLRLGLTGRRILANLIFQNYKGMYISNPQELISSGVALSNFIRPDVHTEMGFGVLNYFFNYRRYSCMASLWQIDRQKKSAGSWVLGSTATYMHIGGNSTFVPGTLFPDQRIIDNYNYMFGVNAGYACNIVIRKHWFLNMMLIPGVNMQYGYNFSESGTKNDYGMKPGYHGDLRVIGGYNGEQYYFGIHSANYLVSNSIKDNVDVYLGYTYFRVFVGRRFHIPLPFHKT